MYDLLWCLPKLAIHAYTMRNHRNTLSVVTLSITLKWKKNVCLLLIFPALMMVLNMIKHVYLILVITHLFATPVMFITENQKYLA